MKGNYISNIRISKKYYPLIFTILYIGIVAGFLKYINPYPSGDGLIEQEKLRIDSLNTLDKIETLSKLVQGKKLTHPSKSPLYDINVIPNENIKRNASDYEYDLIFEKNIKLINRDDSVFYLYSHNDDRWKTFTFKNIRFSSFDNIHMESNSNSIYMHGFDSATHNNVLIRFPSSGSPRFQTENKKYANYIPFFFNSDSDKLFLINRNQNTDTIFSQNLNRGKNSKLTYCDSLPSKNVNIIAKTMDQYFIKRAIVKNKIQISFYLFNNKNGKLVEIPHDTSVISENIRLYEFSSGRDNNGSAIIELYNGNVLPNKLFQTSQFSVNAFLSSPRNYIPKKLVYKIINGENLTDISHMSDSSFLGEDDNDRWHYGYLSNDSIYFQEINSQNSLTRGHDITVMKNSFYNLIDSVGVYKLEIYCKKNSPKTILLDSTLKYFTDNNINNPYITDHFYLLGSIGNGLADVIINVNTDRPKEKLSFQFLNEQNEGGIHWPSDPFDVTPDYNFVVIGICLALIITIYAFLLSLIRNLTNVELLPASLDNIPSLKYKINKISITMRNLRLRSDFMLFLGIILGIVGIGAYILMLDSEKKYFLSIDEWKPYSVVQFARPLVLLIFIETISFYFFKQYRVIFADYKLFYSVYINLYKYFHIIEIKWNNIYGNDSDTQKQVVRKLTNENFDLSLKEQPDEVKMLTSDILNKIVDKIPNKP